MTSEILRNNLYLPYEEVKEICLREAPAYYAMLDWQKELSERETEGEEIDLVAEAERLGLTHVNDGEARDRQGWMDLPYGGRYFAQSMPRGEIDKLIPRVTVEKGSFILGRILNRVEPSMPPFAEIRDRVADAWVTENLRTRSTERLQVLFDTLLATAPSEEPDNSQEITADRFAAAAQELGFEALQREWEEREPREFDPEPTARYFRYTPDLYTLREGELAEPTLSRDGSRAFLVLQNGIRDPDSTKMTPDEVTRVREVIRAEAEEDFSRKNLNSPAYFERNYQFEATFRGDEDEGL